MQLMIWSLKSQNNVQRIFGTPEIFEWSLKITIRRTARKNIWIAPIPKIRQFPQELKCGPQIASNAQLSPCHLLVYWMILDQMEFKQEWNWKKSQKWLKIAQKLVFLRFELGFEWVHGVLWWPIPNLIQFNVWILPKNDSFNIRLFDTVKRLEISGFDRYAIRYSQPCLR